MKEKHFIAGMFVGALLAAAGYALALFLWNENHSSERLLSDPARMSRLTALEDMIDQYYLEETDDEQLAQGIYHGLIYGLGDPYSRYYSPEEYARESADSEGSYEGIGVMMYTRQDGTVAISEVYEGSPSEAAGLLPDDTVLSVNGQDAQEMGLSDLVSYVKEHVGEELKITVLRDGEDPLTVTVPYDTITLPTVESEMLQDRTGYIAVSEFKGVTEDQFREAYLDLQDQGMESLIVDLRGNPGGYVTSVSGILRMILPKGLIFYTEDKFGTRIEENCEGETPIDIPLAVLVDGNSASASELFAGAVQDHGIGTIIGQTTYGKGIVQSVRSFQDGSAVRLTTSRYYTPDGHNIHQVGIQPDIEITDEELSEASSGTDVYIETALKALKE